MSIIERYMLEEDDHVLCLMRFVEILQAERKNYDEALKSVTTYQGDDINELRAMIEHMNHCQKELDRDSEKLACLALQADLPTRFRILVTIHLFDHAWLDGFIEKENEKLAKEFAEMTPEQTVERFEFFRSFWSYTCQDGLSLRDYATKCLDDSQLLIQTCAKATLICYEASDMFDGMALRLADAVKSFRVHQILAHGPYRIECQTEQESLQYLVSEDRRQSEDMILDMMKRIQNGGQMICVNTRTTERFVWRMRTLN